MMVRPLLLVAALGVAWASPGLAEEAAAPVAGPDAALKTLFEAHEQAVDSHNLKALMALYAPGEQAVLMGTGPGELWVGSKEIREAYKHFFEDFDAGSIKRECSVVTSDISGDIGWLTATCNYQDAKADKTRTFELNVSAVLQEQAGTWKLRAMHFSNLTKP